MKSSCKKAVRLAIHITVFDSASIRNNVWGYSDKEGYAR